MPKPNILLIIISGLLWSTFFSVAEQPSPSVPATKVIGSDGDLDFIGTVQFLKSQGALVDIEAPLILPAINLHFKKTDANVRTVLDQFKIASGFDYSLNGKRIVLYDPKLHSLDMAFPLNKIIEHFEVTNMPHDEAIEALSKQSGVSLQAITLNGHTTNITLRMNHASIVDIFNEIGRQAKDRGWYCYVGKKNNGFDAFLVF